MTSLAIAPDASAAAARIALSPAVGSVPVDDEILLLDRRTRAIHRLNPAAACVWIHLEMGAPRAAAAHALGRVMGLSADAAAELVRRCLRQWARRGLLGNEPARQQQQQQQQPPKAEEPIIAILDNVPDLAAPPVAIAGCRFDIRFSDEGLRRAALPALSPSEADGLPLGAEPITLSIVRTPDGILLGEGRVLRMRCARTEEVAPLLKGYLLHLAMRQGTYRLAVHAAALDCPQGRGSLLLAGESGAGKSTLSAALAAQGWRCMADDITFLSGAPAPVPLAVPLNISVKTDRGSPLQGRAHGMDRLPLCRLGDGRPVRFVPLPATRHPAPPLRWLVFPAHDPVGPTRLRPLGRAEALQRLLCHVEGPTGDPDAARLHALAEWLRDVAAWELRSPTLDDALAGIRRLCDSPSQSNSLNHEEEMP